MAACSGCGERDGRIGHGKRRSRTGMRLRATPAVLSLSEALAHMKPGGRLPTEPPLTRVPPPSDLAIPQEPDNISDHLLPAALKPVGNQQKWDTLRAERSGAVLRCGELPEGHVVLSSPFDCLSLHLPSAL